MEYIARELQMHEFFQRHKDGTIDIARNVTEVIDLGDSVIGQLNELRNTASGFPKAFHHLSAELPAYTLILRNTLKSINCPQTSDFSR